MPQHKKQNRTMCHNTLLQTSKTMYKKVIIYLQHENSYNKQYKRHYATFGVLWWTFWILKHFSSTVSCTSTATETKPNNRHKQCKQQSNSCSDNDGHFIVFYLKVISKRAKFVDFLQWQGILSLVYNCTSLYNLIANLQKKWLLQFCDKQRENDIWKWHLVIIIPVGRPIYWIIPDISPPSSHRTKFYPKL